MFFTLVYEARKKKRKFLGLYKRIRRETMVQLDITQLNLPFDSCRKEINFHRQCDKKYRTT